MTFRTQIKHSVYIIILTHDRRSLSDLRKEYKDLNELL